MNTKSRLLKTFDYFFILRPMVLLPLLTMVLAGYWAQQRFGEPIENTLIFTMGNFDISILVYLFTYFLLLGGVFLINQIEDIETDRLNNKLYLIADGEISEHTAYIETFLVVGLPILFMLWKRLDLGINLIISYIVMGWLYSSKPFKMKDKPIGGMLINFIGGFIVFIYGWMINSQLSWKTLTIGLPYMMGFMAVYFFTTIPDIEGDKAVNKITFAVKYGKNTTLWFGLLADVVAILVGLLNRDIIVLIPTIIVLPFFIYSVIKKEDKEALFTNKITALMFALVICYRFPLYFIFILFLFYFSKWYYKARFNLNYPSFKKE